MADLDATSTTAVIVLAHGSRAAAANDAHQDLCGSLSTRTGLAVHAAFLELARPDLPAAVAELAEQGATRVLVVPLFLHPGRHLRQDVPALVAAAREAHPGLVVDVGPSLGEDPGLVELLAGQVTTALAD